MVAPSRIIAQEGPVRVARLVEHFSVWLDPLLVDQLALHSSFFG